jgi:hypothetical protein
VRSCCSLLGARVRWMPRRVSPRGIHAPRLVNPIDNNLAGVGMISWLPLRRGRAAFIMVVLACALSFLAPRASVSAQNAALTWSRPIPISGALLGSRFPSLVADDQGDVFLFWNLAETARSNTIYVSKYENGIWLRPVDVLIGGPRPLARLDGRQILHVMLNDGETLKLAEADAATATSVHGWSTRMAISRQGGGVLGDYQIDDAGNMRVVWLQGGPTCEGCYSVAFQKFDSETSPDLTYRVLSDVETVPQRLVQLVTAPSGTLYVMWDQEGTGRTHAGVELSLSTDDGATWRDTPRSVNFQEADVRQPLLFVDSANQLVLVFNYGNRDEVYYSVSQDEGETWRDPLPIPQLFSNLLAANTDYFAAATDSAGVTHLIAGGRASKTQPAPGLYHTQWDGKQWRNLVEIYRGDTLVENPSIALGNGNRLHVSFATRTRASSTPETSQVWYTTAQTEAPAATRVPLPTFTPVPTDTPTAVPTETPPRFPSPTPIPDDAAPPDAETPQFDSQFPILVGVVPVVAILLVVLIAVSLTRRR